MTPFNDSRPKSPRTDYEDRYAIQLSTILYKVAGAEGIAKEARELFYLNTSGFVTKGPVNQIDQQSYNHDFGNGLGGFRPSFDQVYDTRRYLHDAITRINGNKERQQSRIRVRYNQLLVEAGLGTEYSCLASRFFEYLSVEWLPEMINLIESDSIDIGFGGDHVYTELPRVYYEFNRRNWQTYVFNPLDIEKFISDVYRSRRDSNYDFGCGFGGLNVADH